MLLAVFSNRILFLPDFIKSQMLLIWHRFGRSLSHLLKKDKIKCYQHIDTFRCFLELLYLEDCG